MDLTSWLLPWPWRWLWAIVLVMVLALATVNSLRALAIALALIEAMANVMANGHSRDKGLWRWPGQWQLSMNHGISHAP